MNVLVIDELVGQTPSLAEDIRRAGHVVLEASSPESACNQLARGLFRQYTFDAVVFALKPSGSAAFQYDSAATMVSHVIQAAGGPRPAIVFLPVSGDLPPSFLALATDIAATVIPRREAHTVEAHLTEVNLLPRVLGVHTCIDPPRCSGKVSEICVDVPEYGPVQLPLGDATAFYFDFLAQFVNWKRPQPADTIVHNMLDIDFYREGLGENSITKRAFITNWYRITKAQESFPFEFGLLHTQYPGKKTVYAIKCDYRVVHPATE